MTGFVTVESSTYTVWGIARSFTEESSSAVGFQSKTLKVTLYFGCTNRHTC